MHMYICLFSFKGRHGRRVSRPFCLRELTRLWVRRRRRPPQRADPCQRFRARQSRTSDLSGGGARRLWDPRSIWVSTEALAGHPRQPSPPWAETRLREQRATRGDTTAQRGPAPGFRVARGLNSTEGIHDSYSQRWLRAPKGIVSGVLCGVVPAFRKRAVSGPPAGLVRSRSGAGGGRGRNAQGRTRISVSREGGGLGEHRRIRAHGRGSRYIQG